MKTVDRAGALDALVAFEVSACCIECCGFFLQHFTVLSLWRRPDGGKYINESVYFFGNYRKLSCGEPALRACRQPAPPQPPRKNKHFCVPSSLPGSWWDLMAPAVLLLTWVLVTEASHSRADLA